ncbi:MAG TPA: iron uptake transporter deferrochelatase/peroxidase subunit [Streptosporangiaceae bacterium]|jgi:deferrochelatase/peroxidase EfeB|nr:iron uptake transporter deferrochelatase/peroxidase subunit [Streptosporangiaceae bacterium]
MRSPHTPAESAGDGPGNAQTDERKPGPSRRGLLTGAGAAGAGLIAGGLGGYFAHGTSAQAADQSAGSTATVPFYAEHQAGIATPAQDRLAFGSLNAVAGATRADLRELLRAWTEAAARMTAGKLVGEDTQPYAPPVDTGEAVGSPVSRLTVTVGYGPSLFDQRFGLATRKPAALADLPPLPNENLDPNYTGGDLCVQACSDDPLVAFHAVRNLARIGMGVVEHNWMELGFGRTSTTTTSQQTPRNLLGFKDGTRNVKAEQASLMNGYVWVGGETDQPWLRGGSYLVARKIRIFVENWDRDYLQDQEHVIGRAKVSGAPLTGGTEFTTPNFAAKGADGRPVIPANAHMRLASFEHNGGTRILRRGYSFTDGIDPQVGTLLGGLFFIAFMKNPAQFVKLQTALATDALNEYIHHTGSAVFACPPGLRPGQHFGDTLFT